MNKTIKKAVKKLIKFLDGLLAKLPFNGGKLYISLVILVLGGVQFYITGIDPTLSELIGQLIEELTKLKDLTLLDTGALAAVIAAVHKVIKAAKNI